MLPQHFQKKTPPPKNQTPKNHVASSISPPPKKKIQPNQPQPHSLIPIPTPPPPKKKTKNDTSVFHPPPLETMDFSCLGLKNRTPRGPSTGLPTGGRSWSERWELPNCVHTVQSAQSDVFHGAFFLVMDFLLRGWAKKTRVVEKGVKAILSSSVDDVW